MSWEDMPLIHKVFARAEDCELPLWLESGWAIDARLGRVTRPHDDVDLAFPSDRREMFESLLGELGCDRREDTDYGFLVRVQGVLFDCEPCVRKGGAYEVADAPPGSCPSAKEGTLAGVSLRCLSWEAILWEYLFYEVEVSREKWRDKDHIGFSLVCRTLGGAAVDALRDQFRISIELR